MALDEEDLGRGGHVEDVYVDPNDWFLPARVVSTSFVAGERVLPGDAVSLGSDGHLHLIRDGAVPFAVVRAPYSEGEIVLIRALVPDGTWSNQAPGPPLTLEMVRAAVAETEAARCVRAAPVFPVEPGDDGVAAELSALARAGDEARFRELAACVMPAADVDACWRGARLRTRSAR